MRAALLAMQGQIEGSYTGWSAHCTTVDTEKLWTVEDDTAAATSSARADVLLDRWARHGLLDSEGRHLSC